MMAGMILFFGMLSLLAPSVRAQVNEPLSVIEISQLKTIRFLRAHGREFMWGWARLRPHDSSYHSIVVFKGRVSRKLAMRALRRSRRVLKQISVAPPQYRVRISKRGNTKLIAVGPLDK
jgi:hypothetical protein